MTNLTHKNWVVKLLKVPEWKNGLREVGDKVYCHIYDDGKVLFFHDRQFRRGQIVAPYFSVLFNSIDEAKKYGTCIEKTDYDIYGAYSKMLDKMYW